MPFGGRTAATASVGIGEVERAVLAAEEAAGGERLQLLRLADAFEALADVDERRDGGVVRAADLRDPRAEVRAGDRLRRDVAGVPVVLVPRVQDVAQVGDDVRADQRRPGPSPSRRSPAPARS